MNLKDSSVTVGAVGSSSIRLLNSTTEALDHFLFLMLMFRVVELELYVG